LKSAIFSLLPVKRGSTIASVRIGRWLSDLLGIPLCDDASILEEGKLDNLFIVNGSTLYCHYLPEVAKAVGLAKNVIWVQNDYTLPPPKDVSDAQSPFRRAFADRGLVPHYWTTCSENANKTDKSAWVNWNVLGYKKNVRQAYLHREKAIYYGAYRENRSTAFAVMNRAFEGMLDISSTSKKFHESVLVPPFREDFYDCLCEYGLGIYAQDAKSAMKKHCPATRFYEMLSVGLPMVFMQDCVETLKIYGYEVAPYVVHSPIDANVMMAKRDFIGLEQSRWREDFESNLIYQIRNLYDSLDGGTGVLDQRETRDKTA
jgi:hypothetical protein